MEIANIEIESNNMSTSGYILFLMAFVLMIGALALWTSHYDKTHPSDND